jgi:hypothetical protein
MVYNPAMEEKYVSFAELKQSIWDGFLEDPGSCERAYQAAHLAEVFLPRSPGRPADTMAEITKFVDEITTRHHQSSYVDSDSLCSWHLRHGQVSD